MLVSERDDVRAFVIMHLHCIMGSDTASCGTEHNLTAAQVYQHWTKDVTHIIAVQKDAKFHAHVKQQRDVVSLDWLLECEQESELKPIKPHHYLHLSKKTLQEVPDVCRFGDL